MSDPTVRQDEKSRPTTVEHMKQLRDRVEKTIIIQLEQQEQLQKYDQVDARLARIEQEVERLAKVADEVAASQEGVHRKLNAVIAAVHSGDASIDEA